MAIELSVNIPFKNYKIGDRIRDPEEIKKAMEANEAHVVRVRVQDKPAAAPAPAKAAP